MTAESALIASLSQKLVDTAASHCAIYTTTWNQLDPIERDRIRLIAEHALALMLSGGYPPEPATTLESKDYAGVLTDAGVSDYAPQPDYFNLGVNLSRLAVPKARM